MEIIGFASIAIYVIACLLMGFRGASKIKTLKEFALGYKNIPTGLLVATIYATHLGAGVTLGLIEQINNIGIICAITAIGGVFQWYFTRFIFCRDVVKFQDCLSQAHIMEKLYGPFGLWVANIVNVVDSIGVVAIQVIAIGFLGQHFLGLPPALGALLGAGVVTMYAASGGIKAVILTDLVQATLFWIIIPIVLILALQKFSTPPNLFDSIPKSKAWIMPYDGHSTLLVIAMAVYAFLPVGENAPIMQRILISRSKEQLYKAFSYIALIDLLITLSIVLIALILLTKVGEGTLSKAGIFEIISSSMHPVLLIMTIIGILAVIMSTADSWLNAGAVILTHDIINKIKPGLTDKQQITIARLATLLLGVAAAQLALMGDSVLSLLLLIMCFHKPLILIPLSAGFLGYNCTALDFKRSVFCAITGVFLGGYAEGELGFISLLFGLIGSAVGLFWGGGLKRRSVQPASSASLLPYSYHVTPMFFIIISALATATALIHTYVSEVWLITDLPNLGCLVTTLIGFYICLWGDLYEKTYKNWAMISIVLLIMSISNLAFRTGNEIAITCLLFSVGWILLYRQWFAVMLGLLLGFISINFWYVLTYIPSISLSTLLISLLSLTVACTAIYGKEMAEQFKEALSLSLTDALTKLPNRRYLDMHMDKLVKHAIDRAQNFSIMVIDIDLFKQINDTYGHLAGDDVLKELGRLISTSIRPPEICARLGGEEFVMVMPGANLNDAKVIAERLRCQVAETRFNVRAKQRRVLTVLDCTVSIGVADVRVGDTRDSITQRADAALYEAKEGGRNKVITAMQEEVLSPPAKIEK